MYIVYKTTNLVNGSIYIGVHNRDDDEYIGSGRMLHRAIKKYGIDNFSREIIKRFENSLDAYLFEKELVTEDFVSRKDTYNMKTGGNGGFDFINKNKDFYVKKSQETINNWDNDKKLEVNTRKVNFGDRNGMHGRNRSKENNPMYMKKHKQETVEKIRELALLRYANGYKNPKIGKPISQKAKDLVADKNSKEWVFVDPTGNIIRIKNLEKFCRENSLNPLCMSRVFYGKNRSHKGYHQYYEQ